jgi:hypothetical protein
MNYRFLLIVALVSLSTSACRGGGCPNTDHYEEDQVIDGGGLPDGATGDGGGINCEAVCGCDGCNARSPIGCSLTAADAGSLLLRCIYRGVCL